MRHLIMLSCMLVASAAAVAEGMVRAEVIAEGAKTAEADAGGPSWKKVLLAAGLGALAATGGMAQAQNVGGRGLAEHGGHGLAERGPGLELAAGAWTHPVVHTDHGLFAVDSMDVAEPSGLVAEPDKLVTEPDELGKMLEDSYPWRKVYDSYMNQLRFEGSGVQTAVDGLVKLAHSESSHVTMPVHMQAQIVQAFANLANSAWLSDKHARAGVSGLRAMIAGPSLPRGAAAVAAEALAAAAADTREALDVLPELFPHLGAEEQGRAVQTLVWACIRGRMLSSGHALRGARGLGALAREPAAQTAEVVAALGAVAQTEGQEGPEPGTAAVAALAGLAEALPHTNPLKAKAVDALVAAADNAFSVHKEVRAAAVKAMTGLTL